MSLEVVDRAPEVRCYRCGSTDIRSVCHHCSRPMCARHGSVPVRERAPGSPGGADGTGAVSEPGAYGDEEPADPEGTEGTEGTEARPASREFAGLKLLPIREAVHHCQDHYHTVGRLGAGITAASGVLRRRQTPASELPPLPVFPDVNTVSVVERLTGEVRLTDAGYVSTPRQIGGEIVIGMTHAQARWQETMGRYRKRHQLPEGYPVRFAAGFALLRGKAGLAFDAGQEAILPDGLGLVFRGDVHGHDLFDAKRGRPQGEWELTARYGLQPARVPRDIPLWIVPSLGATSDKRVLMIDLYWNMPEVDGNRAELNQFELIEFRVPHQWGNLQDARPSGAASSAPVPGQPRIVRWRQHRPAAGDRPSRSGRAAAPRSMTLKMEFERPIMDQPRLSGALRATFNRTLSGVTGMSFYLPGGGPVKHLDVRPRTEISVGFDISLSTLRYQERRAVPDDSKAAGEDRLRPRSDEFSGVMPDYRTVIELTNAISADGYYVKTVVEDHPNRDPRDRTFKRGWDITGRWYEGVFPINFIISLRGTEPEDGVAGPALGRTVAEVSVDGTFPNAEMKKKIEDKWDGLHARVTELLAARAVRIGDPGPGVIHGLPHGPQGITAPGSPAPGSLAPGSPAPAIPSPSVPPTAIGRPVAPSSAWPGAPEPDEDPGETVVPGVVIGRREAAALGGEAGLPAELQRQRKDLRLLFAEAGLIGERTCQEAIADIRAELRYLEQPGALLAGPRDHRTEAEVAGLLRQRKGLRGKLIAGQLSEPFYDDEVADISAELKDLGWLQ
jgi:hypothetical protein